MSFAILLLACADDDPVDTGPAPFAVTNVDPDDGGTPTSEISPVQLVLSARPDMSRCNSDTVRIDGVLDDGSVGFNLYVAMDLQGDGNLRLQPAEPYFRGYTYAVTIQGGDSGCTDVDGRAILPFFSTFEVP